MKKQCQQLRFEWLIFLFHSLIFKWKMRNAPRLAPQLAQNGSFCANYKRKYCSFKTNTLSSHTRLTKRIVGLLSPSVFSLSLSSVGLYSAVALSLERGSLFCCGSLSLAVDLSHLASRASRCSLLRLSLVVGLSHASCYWKLAKCYCVYELLILG